MDEDEYKDWSRLDSTAIKQLPTRELIRYLSVLENLSTRKHGEATSFPSDLDHPDADALDTRERIYDELGRRLSVRRIEDMFRDWLEDIEEKADGMQYAIDQLKNHRHAEKTGEPVRPF